MSKRVTLFGLLALFVAGISLGIFHNQQNLDPLSRTLAHVSGDPNEQVRKELGLFAKLAKELKPSVVGVSVVKATHQTFPFTDAPETTGQGSGVIISPNGEILTNNHVVEGATEIGVELYDGRNLTATVVGTDPNTDLALLKIPEISDLPAATLGSADALEVGDWVMAIGNPFGLEATVTVGVLSGKGRVIGAGPYDDFLQTDASINPGNSGGPLFDTSGRVVGINTAIIRGGQGIGFSIPIEIASFVADQIRENGRVVRGFLGVGVQKLTPALKNALDLPYDLQGALISSVLEGPARRAGVRVQDVVTAIDGKPIQSDRHLLEVIARTTVGKKVRLDLYRDGKTESLDVTVTQRPDRTVGRAPSVERETPRLGVRVQSLTPGLASQLHSKAQVGVIIIDVMPGSPAARAGLQSGDIIRRIGRQEIEDIQDFMKAIDSTSGELALLVERHGRDVFVVAGG